MVHIVCTLCITDSTTFFPLLSYSAVDGNDVDADLERLHQVYLSFVSSATLTRSIHDVTEEGAYHEGKWF